MEAVLPPGAWWDVVNGVKPAPALARTTNSAAGQGAGVTAVEAAARGPLEIRDISFAYPMRPSAKGAWTGLYEQKNALHDGLRGFPLLFVNAADE